MNALESFIYCPRCGKKGFEDRHINAKYCPNCNLSFYGNVATAVACLIRNTKHEYLFVRRGKEPAKGSLDLSGGFVDPNETLEEAIKREIFEETHLNVSKFHYLTSIPNIYPYSGIEVYTLDQFFLVQVEDFSNAQADDDAESLYITTLDQIKAQDFGLKSIKEFISRVEKGVYQL